MIVSKETQTMNQPTLLTDDQMQHFIVHGYLSVEAAFPTPVHQEIYQRLEEVFEKEKNPGNNVLPRVTQLQQVFDHPAVHGALTSILGPNYLMNSHRHCHLNPPGSKGQMWHKDNYVFDEILRRPRPRWVFAFYYPQDVTADMGPTSVIPGRHYYHYLSDADPIRTVEPALPICGAAGTVAIVHYDSWHRAAANQSEKKRYMLKFLFERMEEPQAPTWDNRVEEWQPVAADPHGAVNAEVWHWLAGHKAGFEKIFSFNGNGKTTGTPNGAVPHLATALAAADESTRSHAADELARLGEAALPAAPQLLAALRDPAEAVRLNAAHALGELGEPVIPALINALTEEAIALADQINAKMPGNPRGSNPPACPAAHALSAIGQPAVVPLESLLNHEHWCVRAMAADTLGNIGQPAYDATRAVAALLDDEHPRVRRHAAEALGRFGPYALQAVPEIIEHVRDPDVRVRHNAALALAKIGASDDSAIPPLVETLNDEDRYVRYFAGVALRRLDTPAAQAAIMDHLFMARWCPLTTKESMY